MTVHCPFCSKEIKVNRSGNLTPHRSGKIKCHGSGTVAKQMADLAEHLREVHPGADLAKKFKNP